MNNQSFFTKFAQWASVKAGHASTFGIAVFVVVTWAATGPLFGYSDTWQLVINTSTTIITFLMVFLIQNSQNRDTRALEIKLDELIRVTEGAHTVLLDLEELDEEELERIQHNYSMIAARAREALNKGLSDTGTPDIEISSKS